MKTVAEVITSIRDIDRADYFAAEGLLITHPGASRHFDSRLISLVERRVLRALLHAQKQFGVQNLKLLRELAEDVRRNPGRSPAAAVDAWWSTIVVRLSGGSL